MAPKKASSSATKKKAVGTAKSRVHTRASALAVAGVGGDAGATATNIGVHGTTADPATSATTVDPTTIATTVDPATIATTANTAPRVTSDPTVGMTANAGSIGRVIGGDSADAHDGTATALAPGLGAASGSGGNAGLVFDSGVHHAGAAGNTRAQAVVPAVTAARPGAPTAPATPTVENALLVALGTLQYRTKESM